MFRADRAKRGPLSPMATSAARKRGSYAAAAARSACCFFNCKLLKLKIFMCFVHVRSTSKHRGVE
ncbi:MAG TPA: hypothetical protein VFY72_00310, partial [Beijerinckiaceae bacterium]|nr:hypothetical protein [Beijerinckiaceae bacterium]